MPEFVLHDYPEDSHEAALRVLAMFVLCDGEVTDEEMSIIEEIGALKLLGADRNQFAEVLANYCDDLIRNARSDGTVGLADPDWVDAVVASVTQPDKRRVLAQTLLLMARSDGYFADAELLVYRRVLDTWNLDIDDLV